MTLREWRERLFGGIRRLQDRYLLEEIWKEDIWPSYQIPPVLGIYSLTSRHIYEETGDEFFLKWSDRLSDELWRRVYESPNGYLPRPENLERARLTGLDINWAYSSLAETLAFQGEMGKIETLGEIIAGYPMVKWKGYRFIPNGIYVYPAPGLDRGEVKPVKENSPDQNINMTLAMCVLHVVLSDLLSEERPDLSERLDEKVRRTIHFIDENARRADGGLNYTADPKSDLHGMQYNTLHAEYLGLIEQHGVDTKGLGEGASKFCKDILMPMMQPYSGREHRTPPPKGFKEKLNPEGLVNASSRNAQVLTGFNTFDTVSDETEIALTVPIVHRFLYGPYYHFWYPLWDNLNCLKTVDYFEEYQVIKMGLGVGGVALASGFAWTLGREAGWW